MKLHSNCLIAANRCVPSRTIPVLLSAMIGCRKTGVSLRALTSLFRSSATVSSCGLRSDVLLSVIRMGILPPAIE